MPAPTPPPAIPAEVKVRELWESRDHTFNGQQRVDLSFVVLGTDDDRVAKAAARRDTPAYHDDLPRAECRMTRVGQKEWVAAVGYYFRDGYQMSTVAGSITIYQSLETVGSYAPPGMQAPNHHGAINVTRDGVAGVEVPVQFGKFTLTKAYPPEDVTEAFRQKLLALAPSVNNDAFRGYALGEVKYCGATFAQRGPLDYDDDGDPRMDWVEVSFEFEVQKNRDDIVIESPLGQIGPIEKQGWDYLWIRYADRQDVNAPFMAKVPVAVYVERVIYRRDFADLELPDPIP